MPTANQYGIDLGNILSTASDIKTARLARETRQRALDKDKAGERNMLRKLKQKNVKYDDISGTTSIKDAEQANALNTPTVTNALAPKTMGEEEMQDIALNPTIYNEDMAKQETAALVQRRNDANKVALRMSLPNATPAEIETLSQQKTADVSKFITMAMKGGESAKKNAILHIDKQARIMMQVTQAGNGIQDPAMKQKAIQDAYTLARDTQIQNAQTPEDRKKISDSIPALYDANWVGQRLAESKDVHDTIQKSLEAEQKNKNASNLEEQKQSNRLELAQLKANAPTGKSKKEFMQIMDILEKGNITPQQKRFYENRLTKLSQPDMKSKEVDINTANKLRGEFATKLKLDNPYSLATIDMRNLTPEQQAEANTIGQNLVKLSGANAKEVDKKMANYGSMLEQTNNALTAYKKVGDFRLVDEKVKQYLSNYTGLTKSEIESTEATQALQSLLNISIKADSGSAVSAQEMLRKTLETSSATMNKQRIILGMKNLAKRNIGELKGLKKVMGPVPFNLRYGGVLRNYEDILKSTDNIKESSKPKSLEELRAAKNPNTPTERVVKRTGKDAQGNKVIQYEDGTIERVGG